MYQKLFALREQRIKPGRDEKLLTAWNGLMLSSFAEASAILERADYRNVADANARFLLSHLQKDGLLLKRCLRPPVDKQDPQLRCEVARKQYVL